MMPTRPRRALIANQGQWLALIARAMPSSRRAICRSSVSGFARFEWERPVNRYSLVKVQNHNLNGSGMCDQLLYDAIARPPVCRETPGFLPVQSLSG